MEKQTWGNLDVVFMARYIFFFTVFQILRDVVSFRFLYRGRDPNPVEMDRIRKQSNVAALTSADRPEPGGGAAELGLRGQERLPGRVGGQAERVEPTVPGLAGEEEGGGVVAPVGGRRGGRLQRAQALLRLQVRREFVQQQGCEAVK
jgi:hypothetical protein